ncbi:MAG: polysaccharide biosynthesis tyrosine autokinase, partial [Pseudomonadota bacterium]
AEINRTISTAVNERLLAERYATQLEKHGAASLPQSFASETVQIAKAKLIELRSTYRQKRARMKPSFPEMQKLAAQISEVERNLANENRAIGQAIAVQLEQARRKEASLKEELLRLEQERRTYQRKNIRYTILKREADTVRSHYQTLIAKLSEVGVGAALKTAGATVVDRGELPKAPFSPNLPKNLLLMFGIFGALGAGFIYARELFDNTFATPDQIESDLGLPVLGLIPRLSPSALEAAWSDPTCEFMESYRTLRTSVQFTGTENDIRHILVTSAAPGDGKTTTAVRLAADFAALGRRVLIIDADMRKPRLHSVYGVDNQIGLSNLLSNVVLSGDVKSCFKKTGHAGVSVLTAGTIPPNPADLIASSRMVRVLELLVKRYDMVIVDSPPVMGLSDAPLLSRLVDATLFVVACKSTKRDPAKAAIGRLGTAGATMIGAAFTRFHLDRLDYNFKQRYLHQGYYTYGEKPSLDAPSMVTPDVPLEEPKKTGKAARRKTESI